MPWMLLALLALLAVGCAEEDDTGSDHRTGGVTIDYCSEEEWRQLTDGLACPEGCEECWLNESPDTWCQERGGVWWADAAHECLLALKALPPEEWTCPSFSAMGHIQACEDACTPTTPYIGETCMERGTPRE